MINYYTGVLKNYVGFQGRARRAEFWQFALVNVIVGIILGIVDLAIGSQVLGYIYDLAILLPGLAVLVRRLHDTDKSAWWLLLYLVLFVGWIVLIVFACQEGTPGANKYGPNPKGVANGPADQYGQFGQSNQYPPQY
jgi:uncharacterized membrane protein YhaH (DUF805 family)